jgi:hypothetical protein
MRKLIIWPGISRRIGACGLTHEGLSVFLNGLRSDLEDHYRIYSVLRDEEEPRFFHYLVAFADGGLMHEFDLSSMIPLRRTTCSSRPLNTIPVPSDRFQPRRLLYLRRAARFTLVVLPASSWPDQASQQ